MTRYKGRTNPKSIERDFPHIKRCIIGLAAGMAFALSQAQAMDRDDVFDAFIAATFYETKCGGELSARVKSALDSMAKSYHIEMSDPEDMKKAFERMLARQRSLEESPGRLADFCTKQQVESQETLRLLKVRRGHCETGFVPLGLLSPIFPSNLPHAADYDT